MLPQARERRQRVLLDIALDAELLPERRWPHLMPRGRVRPTPPPVTSSDRRFKVCERVRVCVCACVWGGA
jgi:hypothetical protein